MLLHRLVTNLSLGHALLFVWLSHGHLVLAEEFKTAEQLKEELTILETRGIQKISKQVDMEVYFKPASDVLTEKAEKQLRPLGEVIKDLQDQQFIVEGHTDSKGSAKYNQRLSERRAASVKHFLVSQYDIEGSRITSKGKGEDEPCDSANPEDDINRRVVIVTHR